MPSPMPIAELIADLPLVLRRGGDDVQVADLADDSRRVTPGAAFILRSGAGGDTRRFLADGVQRGAGVVIDLTGPTEPPDDLPDTVAWVSAAAPPAPDDGQDLTGRLADRFFGCPSAQLKVIGVTGTNGKTTVAFLVQHLMAAADRQCGLIGTVRLDTGDPAGPQPASLTTPGAIDLHRHLAAMVAHGCRAVAMECSSHALDQRRADAVRFDAAIFTNLTGDHLDYHGTMDAYAAAKARLFTLLGPHATAVLNLDSDYWLAMRPPQARTLGTSLQPATPADVRAAIDTLTPATSRLRLSAPWTEPDGLTLDLPLVGRHNVMNAIQAAAAVWAVTNVDGEALTNAMRRCPPVPGRLEPVTPEEGDNAGPTVLVDYAHTDDALDNALSAVHAVAPGRLTVVFGCGGDRDRTKRPRMAAVACRWADRIVVTSDNPRTEDARRIIDDILAGIPADRRDDVAVEPDRAAAIAAAIAAADPDDTVLLAGKGHEDYQILPDGQGGTHKVDFDDRVHAAAALRQRARLEDAPR